MACDYKFSEAIPDIATIFTFERIGSQLLK